jgi:hypothetical protein
MFLHSLNAFTNSFMVHEVEYFSVALPVLYLTAPCWEGTESFIHDKNLQQKNSSCEMQQWI